MRSNLVVSIGALVSVAAISTACDGHRGAGHAEGVEARVPVSRAASPVQSPAMSASASLPIPSSAPSSAPAVLVPASASLSVAPAPSAIPTATKVSVVVPRPGAPKTPVTVGNASGSDVLAGTHCQIFPADNYWHADIRSLPVDSHNAAWLAAMGASTHNLHPDFGPSGDPSAPYGIPVTVASAGQARVSVTFDYADESDQVPYPLDAATRIEGGADASGDRHAIVVTADTCELFETWDTNETAAGWTAGSGARWSLSSDSLRPDGWTSADAAGLPILPGLLRVDEVAAGHVDHAIRFTTNRTEPAHLWPARHDASSDDDTSLPPMGARFRLKASLDISRYNAETQVVLRAMQTYGLVLADNGSPWYFQGTADNAWSNSLISQLKTIPANAFEAVDTSGLEISPSTGASR